MVIALTGNKQSGKDTFANLLLETRRFVKRPFVQKLREELDNIFGFKNDQEYEDFKRSSVIINNKPISGRHIVREIGMAMLRSNKDIFVVDMDTAIHNNEKNGISTVIPDLRMENELSYLKELSNKFDVRIYKISRSGYGGDSHITEKTISDDCVDCVIHNDSTLDDYIQKCKLLIDEDILSIRNNSINERIGKIHE